MNEVKHNGFGDGTGFVNDEALRTFVTFLDLVTADGKSLLVVVDRKLKHTRHQQIRNEWVQFKTLGGVVVELDGPLPVQFMCWQLVDLSRYHGLSTER